MVGQQRDTTWPFLCILVCLFALSAASPRIWERVARSQASAQSASAPEPRRLPALPPTSGRQTDVVTQTQPAAAPAVTSQRVDIQLVDPADRSVELPANVGLAERPQAARQPETTEEPPLVANVPSRINPLLRPAVPAPRDPAYPADASVAPEPRLPRAKALSAAPAPIRSWQEPKVLLSSLIELGSKGAAAKWATETERLVRELGPAMVKASPDATAILRRLGTLADQAAPLAASITDRNLARRVRQTGYALSRRLDVWNEIAKLGSPQAIDADVVRTNVEQLSFCLSEVDAVMGSSPEGRAWRQYLLVDSLRASLHGQRASNGAPPRDLAQESLKRLSRSSMSMQQRRFVTSGPVASLTTELRRLTAEPVDPAALLQHLEQYEQSRLSGDARRLAQDCRFLAVSSDPEQCALGSRLDAHYRNANLRLAISAELLNRLMPKRPAEYAPVRDTVLGVPVSGQSLVSTDVCVRLLPNPSRVRLALEASGEVASMTASTAGPATFYNRGTAYYTARKPLEIDLTGVRVEATDVDVYSDVRLRGVETDFDGIPLIGSVVKGIARNQHDQNRAAALREVRHKVAVQARDRLDAESSVQLAEFTKRLNGQVLAPLYALSLDPTMVAAETTEQRFLMRLRLAGEYQLGAHTARPQAPADSLVSVQLHESAVNNAVAGLKLEGKTFTLPELAQHVSSAMSRAEPWESNPEHDDVAITFAEQNAVEVHCQDGQVAMTLSIAKLSKAPRFWKNFQVRACYRPQIDGRSAELVRDGIIHLSGTRLNAGAQIALRGIFAKALPRKTPWNLTPERLVTAPELADQEVTQFTIDDGWIGVALGPKRTTTTTRPAPQRR